MDRSVAGTKKPLEFLEVGLLLGGFAALAVTTLVTFDWYACLVHVIVHGTEVHSPSSTDYLCRMLTTPLGVELGAFWMLHGFNPLLVVSLRFPV
jgi:hypothetical protein